MKNLFAILTLMIFQSMAFAEVIPTQLNFTVDSLGSSNNGPVGYAFFCGWGFKHQSAADADKDKAYYSVDRYNYLTDIQTNPEEFLQLSGHTLGIWSMDPNSNPTWILSADLDTKNPQNQFRYTSISFELGSSTYGAEWFIDICHYRMAANSNIPASITSIVSASNGLNTVLDYVTESGLMVWGEFSCDGDQPEHYGSLLSSTIPIGVTTLGQSSTTGNEIKCISRFHFKENLTNNRINHKGGNFSVHTDYEVLY